MVSIDSDVDVDEVADFVIVGSGAAGGTAARVLAEAGHEVVVLEEGGPPSPAASTREAMRLLYRDGGTQAALGMDVLPLLQGCALGGTTFINGAIQVPMPRAVWEEWARDPALAERLPWDALEAAREQVDAVIGTTPTPAALQGGSGGALLRGLGEQAHPTSRNAPGCEGTGRCMLGCPTGAKKSIDKTMIPMALTAGARIYARCAASRVRIERGRAVGVEARFASGTRCFARARKAVFLAAGAIHTPWLLLRSGVRVGAGFMCHPGAAMAGLFPDSVRSAPEASQAAESLARLDEGIKFESLLMPTALQQARIPGVGRQLAQRVEQLDRVAVWGVAARARARGRVVRGPWGPLVLYTPGRDDRQLLLNGLAIMAEAMLRAGAVEVWPSVYGAPEVVRDVAAARAIAGVAPSAGAIPMVATHLFGGVPVRDRFQVHGVDGLVISDAGLFPSNTGVNPMNAIMSVSTVISASWAEN